MSSDDERPPDRDEGLPHEFEQEFEQEDEAIEEQPRSLRSSIAEVGGGFVALFALAAAVIAVYIAGGVFVGVLSAAAPAVGAVVAALLFARYLRRRKF